MTDYINWHFYDAEKEINYEFSSIEEAHEFLKSQPHARELFCWKEGFSDWKSVRETTEFSLLFFQEEKISKPKPPPPPLRQTTTTNQFEVSENLPAPETILVPMPARIEEISITDSNTEAEGVKAPKQEASDLEKEPQKVVETLKAAEELKSPKAINDPEKIETPEVITKLDASNRKYERHELKFRVILRSQQITFRTFSKNISLGGIATEHPIPRELINENCTIYIANPEGDENIKFNIRFATERQDTKYFFFTEISSTSQAKLKKWIEARSKKNKIPA